MRQQRAILASDRRVGSDSFTYQAFDGALSSGLVTVMLNVEADNQAPSTNPDSYSVDQGTALTVAAPGLLANDSDSNGELDVDIY